MAYVAGSVGSRSMKPNEEVAKVYIVNAARMLSGGH
jgi:hypothetical protein